MAVVKRLDMNHRFVAWWRQAVQWYTAFRAEADKAYDYYDGEQWTPEEKRILESIKQPAIVINLIKSKINRLVGAVAKQDVKLRAVPRGVSSEDAKLASIASFILDYIQDVSEWRDADVDAFRDCVITGLGWLEARKSFSVLDDPVAVGHVDYKEMLIDPYTKKRDLSDSRFLFRYRWLDEDQAVSMFPEAKKALESSVSSSRGSVFELDIISEDLEHTWWDKDRRRVLLIELQYREWKTTDVVWDGVRAVPYKPRLHDSLLRLGKVSLIKASIPVPRVAFMAGPFLLLDEPSPYLHNHFWYIPYWCYVSRKGMPYGVVKALIDPQDEVNKRRSKALHYLTAKRVIAEAGAIEDPDAFMEQLQRPDAFLEYRRGFQIKIERDIELGQQHFAIMQEAANEMQEISGIFPDFYGMPTNARTGAALAMRVENIASSVADIFKRRLKALKTLGSILLALAKQFYTPDFVARLIDTRQDLFTPELRVYLTQEGFEAVRNDLAALEADIKVVLGQDATERQYLQSSMAEVMKAIPPEASLLLLDLYIDTLSTPNKDDVKQRIFALQQTFLKANTKEANNDNSRKRSAERA